jgi:hypothetical protein
LHPGHAISIRRNGHLIEVSDGRAAGLRAYTNNYAEATHYQTYPKYELYRLPTVCFHFNFSSNQVMNGASRLLGRAVSSVQPGGDARLPSTFLGSSSGGQPRS